MQARVQMRPQHFGAGGGTITTPALRATPPQRGTLPRDGNKIPRICADNIYTLYSPLYTLLFPHRWCGNNTRHIISILIILSGLSTWPLFISSPSLILSTYSIPLITRPHRVYLPFKNEQSARQIKNWESAEFTSTVRAMPTAPRLKFSPENSAGIFTPLPPRPSPLGQPVWAMNPAITR